MGVNWAEENLETIRTLMERASVYRHALAPVSIIVGIMGFAAAALAQALDWIGQDYFAGYWISVAVITGGVALILIRRQAVKAGEDFWSPPTRRIVQAMMPLLVVGIGLGVLELCTTTDGRDSTRLAALWMILYGSALHSAGFFMRRGIRLLGWIFVLIGVIYLVINGLGGVSLLDKSQVHWVMGSVFGLGNLLYGIYLRLTAEPMEAE
jgi:hypothetical protein